MENGVVTYQQKAISLRDYLSGDRIKSQISDALPKWLSPDRFFRVVFGAILRNPKLVECTTESILQSVMYCAQLGVEPILGRAYLVPYRKECQAQIGYQGLVDLARRSNTISDIWGSSVYENDVFELSYGMDRNLIHRPWFMDPQKRAAGEPGECIGAYVVWQLKDGTKHPEFMPVHEINKRRAKSPAYVFAETGDPRQGGGKKDSIWHQWPEEMQLKTVIKHSSKLVPANIEFMEAVHLDDERDVYLPQQLEMTSRKTIAHEPGPTFEEAFAAEIADPLFEAFMVRYSQFYNESIEKTKAAAITQYQTVKDTFLKWKMDNKEAVKIQPAETQPQQVPVVPETKPPEPERTFRDEWINLKQSGFSTYVWKHIEQFRAADALTRIEAAEKWKKLYPRDAWPLETKPTLPQETQSEAQGSTISPQPIAGATSNEEMRAKVIRECQSYGPEVCQRAKKALGMNEGDNTWPPTISGVSRLLDECIRISEAEPKA